MSQHAAPQKQPQRYSVWRQDDGGVTYLVASGQTRQDAINLVRHYESLRHKQMYWAEPDEA